MSAVRNEAELAESELADRVYVGATSRPAPENRRSSGRNPVDRVVVTVERSLGSGAVGRRVDRGTSTEGISCVFVFSFHVGFVWRLMFSFSRQVEPVETRSLRDDSGFPGANSGQSLGTFGGFNAGDASVEMYVVCSLSLYFIIILILILIVIIIIVPFFAPRVSLTGLLL